jgi:hypothetical protein
MELLFEGKRPQVFSPALKDLTECLGRVGRMPKANADPEAHRRSPHPGP